MNIKEGAGSCNGTFGELVQGVMEERPFLVTLPVKELKSNALFVPDGNIAAIVSVPARKKARAACQKLLKHFHIDIGGHLLIQSNIPIGKGMASSSADMIAAMRAVADSYSLPITAELISGIAAQIEPTDGVMYDDVVAYDHVNGELIETFGPLPPCMLIGFDTGGRVNTVQFHKRTRNSDEAYKEKWKEAYQLIKAGIKSQSFDLICQATTLSACINQHILPKPHFDEWEELAKQHRGGIVSAHSGTVIGLLLPPETPCIEGISVQIRQRMRSIKRAHTFIFS